MRDVATSVSSGIGQPAWSLDDNDRAVLRRLLTDLRRLLSLAKASDEIMAVGEVVEAVEKVRDGEGVEGVITLSVGVQDGNESFSEGWFVRLGLSPDAIVLDKLNTTYSVEMGLARHATSYAVLGPGGGFDGAGVAAWLAELNELRRWSTAEIHSERVPL
ncbi:MAG: hypothetical protein WAN86_21295 [Hyphomicrobiaceae bacterium]